MTMDVKIGNKPLRIMGYVSLVYGGFLVLLFLTFAYSAFWQREFLPIFPENPAMRAAESNGSAFNETLANGSFVPSPRPRRNALEDPLAVVFSLQSLAILLTGLVFLVNSYFLLGYVRRKEHGEVKKFVTSSLLTDEERAVYEQLIRNGGESTQKQLSLDAGFSAVKTYRVLKRLEDKKIIKSFPYGMTKKIVLNGE